MASGQEGRLSVLYVENDSDLFETIKKNLESDPSLLTILDRALNTRDAIRKIKTQPYDLLLVESDLNGEDGLELLKKIRLFRKNLPSVLMTPVQDEELIREATKFGVVGMIVKSQLHYQELVSKLKEAYLRYHDQKQGAGFLPEPSAVKPEPQKFDQNPIFDALTGVYTHSHFFEKIVEEFARAKRHHYPIACLVLDIDHFKSVNEKWNYRTGDTLLRESVELLYDHCRLSDYVARYGGEEFGILMPYTGYAGAQEVAERLRDVFAGHTFLAGSENIHLTISVGIAAYPEDTITDKFELMSFAVQALSRSKVAGRNRITRYRDILPVFGQGELPALQISEEKVTDFQRRISELAGSARRTYMEAVKAMVMTLESKDPFTAGHAGVCAKNAKEAAEAMGMDSDEAEVVEHAALLHDIGKVCIPDNILLKPTKLTFTEFETMRQHPYLGYKMLTPLKFLDREALLVLHHHEWYNGEGYPCRLKGEEIPLGARIIAVVDAYDTMRNAGGRYKKTCTVEHTVSELIACAGTQFDPRVVNAFIEVLKRRGDLTTDDYDQGRLEEILLKFEPQDPRSAPEPRKPLPPEEEPEN